MRTRPAPKNNRGSLITECVVALGILAAVMLPLAFSFLHEAKLCRAYYHKAVALEIIDGEMEALVAGEWRAFAAGEQPYPVRAASATNLPPGKFRLTLGEGRARLDWIPAARDQGGPVSREAKVK